MRQRFLDAYGRFIVRHRWPVILSCLALTGLSIFALVHMEFQTSRSALQGSLDPDSIRFEEFLLEHGPNEVLVLAEGGSEADKRGFLDALAGRLTAREEIREVFYRKPVEFLRKRALGFVGAEGLRRMAEEVEKRAASVSGLKGVADANRLLSSWIEEGFKSGGRASEDAKTGLEGLRDLARGEAELVRQPPAAASRLEALDLVEVLGSGDPRLAHGGYLASEDGTMYIALVQPKKATDHPDELARLLRLIREEARAARRPFPAVEFGLTGLPVTVVEEAETVAADGPQSAFFAAGGIGILAMIAFRRKSAMVLVLLGLGMGILWNFGLTYLIFRSVNMISAATPVILLALGTDFGIHVVIAYETARAAGRSREEAVRAALTRVGPGLMTSAVTTTLAFYAIRFMKYQGFQEFGMTAGNGVFACLVAMMTALPALLVIADRRPENLTSPGPPPPPEGFPGAPPPQLPQSGLRRTWRLICRATTAFPLLSTILAAGVTVYFFTLARQIGFDYRVEDLLPRNAESLSVQEKLKKDPELSPEFAVILYETREALKAGDEKAAEEMEREKKTLEEGKKPIIERRESIFSVLPPDPPEERAALLDRLKKLLDGVRLDPSRLGAVDPKDLRSSIEVLSASFQRALDLVSTQANVKALLQLLDETISSLDAAIEFLASPPPAWPEEFGKAQATVWSWAKDRKEEVERMLAAGPVKEEELPREILDRLKGPVKGRYLLYLYPGNALSSREETLRFIKAAKNVNENATGYPFVFYTSIALIHEGFSTAVIAAAVVIFLTLLLDFRRLSLVFLATLPKVVGIIWMLGIMRLLHVNYNLANQIVIPVIIGVGLAYGIHIIHRFTAVKPEERNITEVLESTGGAIALSGITTMIGFGSLALANHRGLASMGTVLFFGVGAALVASTYVLANLLCLIYRPRR